MLKECDTNKCQNDLQQLQWKGQGREEDHVTELRDEVEVELNIVEVKSW